MNTEMLEVPAPAAISENIQVGMLKNMVLVLEWFDSDQMKFEDWWRGMRLFLKSNRVMETNNRITVILACLSVKNKRSRLKLFLFLFLFLFSF